ncbi:MAG: BMC domain-containing protein [Phycisphaerae bacterium]|jgi:ethanolamine utilization protein EutM
MAQQAIGMIETRGLVSLVEATDAALKAANVKYRGWKQVGSALCSVVLEGDVAAVKAAVDAGSAAAAKVGEVVSVNVIARPHGDIERVLPNPG